MDFSKKSGIYWFSKNKIFSPPGKEITAWILILELGDTAEVLNQRVYSTDWEKLLVSAETGELKIKRNNVIESIVVFTINESSAYSFLILLHKFIVFQKVFYYRLQRMHKTQWQWLCNLSNSPERPHDARHPREGNPSVIFPSRFHLNKLPKFPILYAYWTSLLMNFEMCPWESIQAHMGGKNGGKSWCGQSSLLLAP